MRFAGTALVEGFFARITQVLATLGAIPFRGFLEALFAKLKSLVASSLIIVEQTVAILAQVHIAVMAHFGARFFSVG